VGKTLVIVESPTKAKTIANFLPQDFVVESSLGHVRDLPTSAKEIPESIKGQPWARLGIDIEHDFEPIYVIPAEKKKAVAALKAAMKNASALYLATDEDREGESISWHLVEVLKPKIPLQRLVFHEITREAIQEALKNPREIARKLVVAQETRRILDRLYGYEISPVLWRKIAPRLSAGRVQSVAIRIIVERERERQRFRSASYWDLAAKLRAPEGGRFEASLIRVGGRRVADGDDFDPATGGLKVPTGDRAPIILDEPAARRLLETLQSSRWRVAKIERKPEVERPSPPFTTSTLQQEANRKLRLSTRETMQAAQRLYEAGYITYMRTDSTTLSEQALTETRKLIDRLYGQPYLSPTPRRYATKVKNAQEAHEAIRPAGDFRMPEDVRSEVGEREAKLYELIWKRTIACQMADARVHGTVVHVAAGETIFFASGRTIDFPGFLRAYVEGADDPDAKLADMEKTLPALECEDECESRPSSRRGTRHSRLADSRKRPW
jgi:DNA topoisomerase-1